MCSIQFECCPSTTVTLGPIKNSLIILSLYLSTVFQSFRAGEKGYYVTHVWGECTVLRSVVADRSVEERPT